MFHGSSLWFPDKSNMNNSLRDVSRTIVVLNTPLQYIFLGLAASLENYQIRAFKVANVFEATLVEQMNKKFFDYSE